MSSPKMLTNGALRIAVEGCGHGTLNAIYASVAKSCELKGWDGVDLLIIGGDFQAVRNAHDLKTVSMPEKYYAMHDFHEYYSGDRTAPYLTIFIGGNHEASNYMWELYYGGWAAPNIYYMGAANVVRLGPLRLAGLSGIWKGQDFKKPHFERLPYNQSEVKSIYHVRELDTRKLLQLRSQLDIGLSHDWPRGMEWKGNFRQLFRFKPYFEHDAKDGTLGSVAAQIVMERLRPPYWFSAHMHAKYAAEWIHKEEHSGLTSRVDTGTASAVTNKGEIDLELDDDTTAPAPKNEAEIDLDMEDDEDVKQRASQPSATNEADDDVKHGVEEIPQDIRDLLPESFARPTREKPASLPFPEEISNKRTNFLALDKCLPNRHFLQLLEVEPHAPADYQRPLKLEYDKEWLAITRVFANDLQIGDPDAHVPADRGDAFYRPLIEAEMDWVEEHLVKPGNMRIPEDFERTAPIFDPALGIRVAGLPQEYTNPHTQAFCELIQIPNHFHASEEERAQMMQKGPRKEAEWADRGRGNHGSYRGGGRNHGRGRGRGRGGNRGGHGRGRGRGQW